MEIDITNFLKKRALLFFVVFLIFILFISFFLLRGTGRTGEFTISNARLVFEQQSIQAPHPLLVQDVHITEGDSVQQGEALLSIQNIVSDEELLRLQKNADLARMNLAQIQSGFIDTSSNQSPEAQEGLEAARRRMERMNELYEMGAVSAAKRNEAAAAYEQEKAALGSVQAVRRADPKAVQAAEEQLKKAELALEKARNTGITELYAQRTGIISKVSVKAGDILAAGDDILALNITDHCWIEARLSEEEARRVYLGQIVRYEINGLHLEGTVEEITDIVTEQADDNGAVEKCVRISAPQENASIGESISDIILHFSS